MMLSSITFERTNCHGGFARVAAAQLGSWGANPSA